jgi:hypothetical protein
VERAESSTIQLVPREDAGSGTRPDALPWIGDRIVARPRVTDAILDRLDRHPLLQVVAPAGAGKTTALVQAAAALELLREPVESMRRGDRTLALASALVYLAEAEWRTGAEEESDRAAAEALEVAERQGSRRELLLALADFPSVHSRRLDLGPAGESVWRSLARALVVRSEGGRGRSANGRGRIMSPVDAHLREFGEPTLVVGEAVVRPKIRKSLELLPYLLAAPSARAPREEILTALWNGRDDEPTRAYLRQALRHLRGRGRGDGRGRLAGARGPRHLRGARGGRPDPGGGERAGRSPPRPAPLGARDLERPHLLRGVRGRAVDRRAPDRDRWSQPNSRREHSEQYATASGGSSSVR